MAVLDNNFAYLSRCILRIREFKKLSHQQCRPPGM